MSFGSWLKTGSISVLVILFSLSVFASLSYTAFMDIASPDSVIPVTERVIQEKIEQQEGKDFESWNKELTEEECKSGVDVQGLKQSRSFDCEELASGGNTTILNLMASKMYNSGPKKYYEKAQDYRYIPWTVTVVLVLLIVLISHAPANIARLLGYPLIPIGILFYFSSTLFYNFATGPEILEVIKKTPEFANRFQIFTNLGIITFGVGVGLVALSFVFSSMHEESNPG